jgi:flagellar basal body rod protein FlgF
MADSDTITFCAAPASGDDIFIIQTGSAITPTTPADGTVTAAKIGSGAVTTAKIADDAVTSAKIADNAVVTAAINADAVTGAKIADDAVGAEHIEVLDSHLQLGDSCNIKIGAGNDLQIYHDGTDNYWETSNGTTHFRVASGNRLTIDGTSGDVSMQGSSGKNLLWDTSAAYLNLNDNAKATFGTDNDLELFHDASNSYIDNSTGELQIRTAYLRIRAKDDGETIATFDDDAGIELYYDGSKKFATQSGGVRVYGDLENHDNNFVAKDGCQFAAGNSGDLAIYHDGTKNYLVSAASTNTEIWSDTFYVKSVTGSGEAIIKGSVNSSVELYYDNTKRFETTSDGAKIDGLLTTTSAIYCENEFNMTNQGNKYIDTAHLDNALYFRRIAGTDTGHSVQCTISSAGVWSADFNDTSDEKLKENIVAIPDGAISKVKQLRPVSFDWKETDKANNVSGFIAQEIKTVLPNLVYGTEYDPTVIDESQGIKSTGYSVNTIGIVAHLTKALQEAS